MNWYEIFYWVTVADGVKSFFDTASNIFTVFTLIALVIFIFIMINYGDARSNYKITEDSADDKSYKFWMKSFRNIMIWCAILGTFTWAGYVFCPTRKDAIMIIAGGAVGNFITSDSSSRQIPAELTLLIREKMKNEIEELKSNDILSVDTLASKSKEELIQLLKDKK